MHSDERHDLKANELERLAARARPYVEKYGLYAVLAVSAIVLLAAGLMYWNRSADARQAAGWSELNSAATAELMLEVADSFPQKPVAAWAKLQAAERYLQTGIRQSLEEREGERGMVSDLAAARKYFEQVLEVAPAKSELQERALYGLGRCLETMAGVNQPTDAENSSPGQLLQEAARAYQKLVDEFPDSPYNQKRFEDEELGRLERHLAYLKTDEAQEFYAWFRQQKPQSPDRRGPFDGLGGGQSPFGGGLPSGHPPLGSDPTMLPGGLSLPEGGPAFPETPQDADGRAPVSAPVPESPAPESTAPADNETDPAGNDNQPATPQPKPDTTDGE